jgi:hypothetical protein
MDGGVIGVAVTAMAAPPAPFLPRPLVRARATEASFIAGWVMTVISVSFAVEVEDMPGS